MEKISDKYFIQTDVGSVIVEKEAKGYISVDKWTTNQWNSMEATIKHFEIIIENLKKLK